MSRERYRTPIDRDALDRRAWLRQTVAGATFACGLGGAQGPGEVAREPERSPAEEAAAELERATARVRLATGRPLHTISSEQFQAVGDAAPSFMKITLGDCELLARAFLDYYQARGFGVKWPGRRLSLVIFLDERPYLEFARKFGTKIPVYASGFYSRAENWLVLYDHRNVPVAERGAAQTNARTLSHEATHLLTFNTGLLNRRGDVPRAVVEGLAAFSETPRLRGRNEPGQVNGLRLSDLAHIRRRLDWVTAAELLTDDAAAFGTTLDHTQLGYAESWLLIYRLMKAPARLPQLQAYLKTIYPRTSKDHRYDDAEKSFGDLDRLDQELRREAILLQQSPPPE